jgi:uncharacterized membrane protein
MSPFVRPVFAETLRYLEDNGQVATVKSLETLFANVIRAVVAFVGVVLFIMLIVSGFTFLLSGGDAKRLEKARGTLTSALAGLVIVVAAYIIILFISKFTGIDITKFVIPDSNP